MRIAILTASVSRLAGGLFTSVRELAQALRAAGVEPVILGAADRHTQEDLGAWGPLQPAVHAPLGPRSFGFAPGYAATLRRTAAEIASVHGLWMYPSVCGLRWTQRTGRPHMVSPEGMLDAWALAHSRWKKQLAARLYELHNLRTAACLRALCAAEAEAFRNFGLRNPICIVPNGVTVPAGSRAGRRPAARACLAAADRRMGSRRVLLHLGRLHPKKGLPALLAGWKAAQREAAAGDWLLALAGWDQAGHERRLRRLASELDIEDSVLFCGPQFGADKEAWLDAADAFVLPSLSEGLPVSVLEAWARELPVLMTAPCNLPEGFAAGAALPVESEAASIARGLAELFALSDAQRGEMGARGRALVQARYQWHTAAAGFLAAAQWVLGGGPPPACVRTD
jgi:poly(glycerol-phosphate) alpha-glucosyltransferase